MKHPTNETYVPLSRGLKDHLPGMAKGYRLNLYIYLLIEARHSGPNKGKVAVSFTDLALFFGVHYQTIVKAARGLKEDGYITYQPAKNQHNVTIFTIDKYKTAADFLAVSPETHSEVRARSERGQSTPRTASKSKDLQGPNNDKECKAIYSREIEEIIDYLNTFTGASFKPTTKDTVRLLNGRLSEDYTVEDCKAVIRHRWKVWEHDTKMRQFIRPPTLFRPSNFESYLQEARRCEKEGGGDDGQPHSVVTVGHIMEEVTWACMRAGSGEMDFEQFETAILKRYENQTVNPETIKEAWNLALKEFGGDGE